MATTRGNAAPSSPPEHEPSETLVDRPVDPDTLPPLTEQPWQPISPRYKIILRCNLAFYGAVIALGPWLPFVFGNQPRPPWLVAVSAAVLAILAFFMVVWVPRKVRFTRYLLRDKDMNMQTGCWWRRTVSVGINRIQHLEVTQGPLERWLGLSTLVLYTAGGGQSDLKLPGLVTERARQLKAHLTDQVASEEAIDAPAR